MIRLPRIDLERQAAHRPGGYLDDCLRLGRESDGFVEFSQPAYQTLVEKYAMNTPVAIPVAQLEAHALDRPPGYLETMLAHARVEPVDGVATAHFEPAVWRTLSRQFGNHADYDPTGRGCCGK